MGGCPSLGQSRINQQRWEVFAASKHSKVATQKSFLLPVDPFSRNMGIHCQLLNGDYQILDKGTYREAMSPIQYAHRFRVSSSCQKDSTKSAFHGFLEGKPIAGVSFVVERHINWEIGREPWISGIWVWLNICYYHSLCSQQLTYPFFSTKKVDTFVLLTVTPKSSGRS